uniref:Retrotransposon protein, putative, Ty3-gypsy subclass n=2 Tax=Oryza sativa subsp. japonica TaxID=39947 RepID=Q850W4_ORYSJ|nr:hypothetical protein [Oryza sativa Japonica Group]ABF96989.1 retrotransposon protein, putative, Ty3-gypsy subclass [Oryza sativa Japonica Group]
MASGGGMRSPATVTGGVGGGGGQREGGGTRPKRWRGTALGGEGGRRETGPHRGARLARGRGDGERRRRVTGGRRRRADGLREDLERRLGGFREMEVVHGERHSRPEAGNGDAHRRVGRSVLRRRNSTEGRWTRWTSAVRTRRR